MNVKKRLSVLGCGFWLCHQTVFADTIDHYINIANNIPQMEMKADAQAQAWARSARNILTLTSETIAETLSLVNETATQQGHPLFCLPKGAQLNGTNLNNLIQQTYREISSQESDKNKLTVSQVAMMGLTKQYPCETMHAETTSMNHVSSSMPDLLK